MCLTRDILCQAKVSLEEVLGDISERHVQAATLRGANLMQLEELLHASVIGLLSGLIFTQDVLFGRTIPLL